MMLQKGNRKLREKDKINTDDDRGVRDQFSWE
jgi:hypothetical protein